MNSLILRGYGCFDRIITRGYGTGWMGMVRTELLRIKTAITNLISKVSQRTGEI
jgi:hypothetical protein